TRFSRDWSSDVCSSDLLPLVPLHATGTSGARRAAMRRDRAWTKEHGVLLSRLRQMDRASVGRAVKFEWHAFWRGRPIQENTILYEAYSGRGMLCNPR